MFRVMQRMRKEEQGEIMLESSIVLTCTLLLLFALLSISFMFYQQAMLNTVASEVAAEVARYYKYPDMDMDTDTVTLDNVENLRLYRYCFGMNGIERGHRERVNAYVSDRIKLTSLGLNSSEPEVYLDIKGSGIGRAYVEVTITQKTDFFMSGILEFLGIYDGFAFKASASAECMDLNAYTSMANFAWYLGGELSMFEPFFEAYQNIKEFILVLAD